MLFICVSIPDGWSQAKREAAVSGMWYASDPTALESQIQKMLLNASPPTINGKIIGLICPHAGYIYSGPVAAHGYKLIENQSYDRVVLIGNAHKMGFTGAMIDMSDYYSTPLGQVPVDKEFSNRLISEDNMVRGSAKPHQLEHSLEAQLPFLQKVLKPGFKIVPILFGHTPGLAFDSIVNSLSHITDMQSTLLIASTDLTHFPSYTDSKRIDARILQAIESMNPDLVVQVEKDEMARQTRNLDCVLCASSATRAVMIVSKYWGANAAKILHQANSGDVPRGDHTRVVGYGSVAFFNSNSESISELDSPLKKDQSISVQDRVYILAFVRNVLDRYVRTGKIPKHPGSSELIVVQQSNHSETSLITERLTGLETIRIPDESAPSGYRVSRSSELLQAKRGVFVTLHEDGNLRGCIGYIEPRETLEEALIQNTINACSRDPRFAKVKPDELDDISIEISVLSLPVPIRSVDEIVIGKHGVILSKAGRSAVFLPQVAPEQMWDVEEMLDNLAMKAGLSRSAWKSGTEFRVFEAQVFSENDLGRFTITAPTE